MTNFKDLDFSNVSGKQAMDTLREQIGQVSRYEDSKEAATEQKAGTTPFINRDLSR
ncbi:MAG: hypothetical protein ACTSXQ_02115 [Alphaproteobacteria bacterium]